MLSLAIVIRKQKLNLDKLGQPDLVFLVAGVGRPLPIDLDAVDVAGLVQVGHGRCQVGQGGVVGHQRRKGRPLDLEGTKKVKSL